MNRRCLILGLPVTILAGAAGAHSWQEGAPGLDQQQVDIVLTALTRLATDRVVDGWQPDEAQGASLAAVVFAFATETDRLTALPPDTERVLITYRALSDGIVQANGRFSDAEDAFVWFDILHLEDVPAVAARREELDELSALFGVKRP